ncbi:nuclease domain-containing protein [Tritonibacter mobilis]|nr:nuclease domain-containing protein [Tritonibacter mobilis]
MSTAEAAPCTLRIASFVPGRQCWGRDTTVITHLPVWGKGKSTKCTDMAGAFGCAACHAIIDGPDKAAREYLMKNYGSAIFERMLNGLTETHALLIQRGVIIIPDAQLI